jgi:hypothetical protein
MHCRLANLGRKRNGGAGVCEAGNLPFVQPSVISRFRPKAAVDRPER